MPMLEPGDEGGLLPSDALRQLLALAKNGQLPSLEPLLPALLNMQGKPFTLDEHFHFSQLFKLWRPQKMVLMTGRQLGKCRIKSFRKDLRLADGRLEAAATLRPGAEVVCYDEAFRATARRVSRVFDTGRQQCYRVTTRMGSVLEVTAEHKIRTACGYFPLRELSVGSRICAARLAGGFGRTRRPHARVVLTALLIGDGACGTSGNFSVTNQTDEVIEACQRWPQHTLSARLEYRAAPTRAVHFAQAQNSPLRSWLEEDGLWGKYSWEKHIPDWVFRLSRAQTRTFLSYLFATDGSIKPPHTIDYCSTSQLLAMQIRSLLNKFGIPSSIRQKESGYTDDEGVYHRCHDAWIVRVETRAGLAAFFENFDVPGKPAFELPDSVENNNRDTIPQDVQHLLSQAAGRKLGRQPDGAVKVKSLLSAGLRRTLKYPPTRATFSAYVQHFEEVGAPAAVLARLQALESTDVIWDEIESIEALGLCETIDFEVEGEHNYVIDGVVTHNSTSLAADGVTLSTLIPYFSTLYITPFFEQIQRFSTLSVQPFIFESPIKHMLIGTQTVQRVLQRTFKNGSRMMFSFATTDAGRTRGLSVKRCSFDEVDDIDHEVLPVILETMSADKKYMLEQYAGTPKATDGTLPRLISRSSHAEWWIPCQHCTTGGKPTWNIPSTEYHLDRMVELGTARLKQGDISPTKPGICCYKCGNPVYPWLGHWEHRRPHAYDADGIIQPGVQKLAFAGYHIPQPITPLHYGSAKKWRTIIGKRNRYTQAKLWNEVYGEPKDEGQKLISQTELIAACQLPWRNNPNEPDPQVLGRLGDYVLKILAVDWGGGGEDGLSTTALAMLGLTPDGSIHVLWGKRLDGVAHVHEARQCLTAFELFKADYIVHDYGGGGTQRETFLRHAGIPASRIRPVAYAPLASQDLVVHKPATDNHRRDYWQMDKTRSLQMTIASIQLLRTLFFRWDHEDDDSPGLVGDFLQLVQHRSQIETMSGPMYRIRGNGKAPDDWAQAVNIGTIALWEIADQYPNFALDASIQISQETLSRFIGDDLSWEMFGSGPMTDQERREFGGSAYEDD